MHTFGEVLNHPAAVLVVMVSFGLFLLKFSGTDFENFIRICNTISPNLFAVILLVIGFWMLVVSHKAGIDTASAGAVIMASVHILQGNKDQNPQPQQDSKKESKNV